ncbi:MAG: hypothetical protein KDB15_16930, partial [Microthrixaceae bacterium]|nr:hypothetical protein [Microthrixaceae bacterium]
LIEPLDPEGVVGARSGGELRRWMLPGDEQEIAVEVVAVGDFFVPLPEGRYRVELALTQDGTDWTTLGGPAATFELVVASS